ncbi:response regulator [Haloarculaceae archaeon H-GB2-1]|nr:response regulator [Haloarculaceae archaeon H-GB11]MEA5406891.1 response regulator [Haloarculaceae archaeon H-GB2-1]
MENVGQSARLLVVDDEPGMADLIAMHLRREREDLTVVTESTGQAALERIAGAPSFDCVVSDYDMPTATGIELLKRLRAETSATAFVLFTNVASDELRRRTRELGGRYIRKESDSSTYERLVECVLAEVTDESGP